MLRIAIAEAFKSYRGVSGGQEGFAVRLAELLSDRCEVALLVQKASTAPDQVCGDILEFPSLNSPVRAARVILRNRRFRPPRVIIANGERALVGSIILRLFTWPGVPVVYIAHIFVPFAIERKARIVRVLYMAVYGWLLRQTTARVCVSESLRQDLEQAIPGGGGSWHVIHNGVQVQPGPRMPHFLRENNHHLRLLFVGRLGSQKGLSLFLDTLAATQAAHSTELWIAGEGPERSALRSQVDRLGLEANVSFLGYVQDVPALLSQVDAMVLPSLYEGLPLALLESMAAAVPVIASNIPPHREVLSSRFEECLVENGDPDALAAALAMLRDRERRCTIGEQLREWQSERFSEDRMFAEYWALIQRVLA